eukprot:scaffold187135_cov25-Tisochrysis_lutea.AAC.1
MQHRQRRLEVSVRAKGSCACTKVFSGAGAQNEQGSYACSACGVGTACCACTKVFRGTGVWRGQGNEASLEECMQMYTTQAMWTGLSMGPCCEEERALAIALPSFLPSPEACKLHKRLMLTSYPPLSQPCTTHRWLMVTPTGCAS